MPADPRDFAPLAFEVASLVNDRRFAEGIQRGEIALREIRQGLGEEHPLVGDVLNAMGYAYLALRDGQAAYLAFRQALEIRRRAFGEDHPGVADVLTGLGELYAQAGHYDGAEVMHRTALGIRRDAFGDRHPDVADSLHGLGQALISSGDFAAPEPLLLEAIDILRATRGDRDPRVADCLSDLASLYGATGDYASAEPLDEEALAIRREVYGERHPIVAESLNNLGALYRWMDDHQAALPCYRQALEIRRETLPANDPALAGSLSNLGVLLHMMGDFADAESLHREALDIRRQVFGPGSTDVGISLECLGSLLRDMGDHEEAERLLREALKINERDPRGQPHTVHTLTDLAYLCVRTGREAEGLTLLSRVSDLHDRFIRQVVATGTERRRLGFLSRLETSLHLYLSLVRSDFADDRDAVRAAFDLVLRRKGMAAEIAAAEREAILGGRYPDLVAQLEELTQLRAEVAQRALAGPGPEGPAAHQEVLHELRARQDALEQQLAGSIPEIGLERRLEEADRDAVSSALPPGSALIEFVKFELTDFRANVDRRLPARYAAFVLRDHDSGGVAMVDLGDAFEIDRLVAAYRSEITLEAEEDRGTGPDRLSGREGSDEGGAGYQLRGAVFDPLRGHLGDRTRLFVSPDGDLSRLPFEVLPDDGEGYLLDRFAISYVSTGRDVLRFAAATEARPGQSVVAADPLFDLSATLSPEPPSEAPAPGRRSADLTRAGLWFGRLAGTRDEGDLVARALGVTPWLEGEVLEARIKSCHSPRILHVATHGFFLPDKRRAAGGMPGEALEGNLVDTDGPMRGGLENPLLRSGLALAGANTFLSKGALPPAAEDGILTAEDVSGLDLMGTELVVLSACETGLGEIRRGEGVFGLRRAFVLAGARTLVMSLWKVPDEATRGLMERFYRRLMAGKPRAEALRDAQLELMKEYPHPWFWGAFICQGDPRPLVSVDSTREA